jgi:hypothetical protein
MNDRSQLNPRCVVACYSPQRIPQLQGNPLIEALPPAMTDEEIAESLLLMPNFDPAQRAWPTHERFLMLSSLANFMVPFPRHHKLARALDSLMRAGYVGRAPRTAEHTQIFQSLYEKQKAGVSFRQSANTLSTQLSTSLIGLSGMGKTTTVTRWLAHVPPVIYHPDLHIYQVPYLHIEMPSDGSSIKGLALAILLKLDDLIPGASYYEDYAVKGRPGGDALIRSVARVMNMHLVGLLICDEVQNLANSFKGTDIVMTELVSACNEMKVPILFIGTNKAAKILSWDFRQARRSSGHSIEPWNRFLEHDDVGDANEWDDFLEVLWKYQWVCKPVALDAKLATTMYYYSQGVIDIAIKLFASAQASAIADGSETISVELIADVYARELKLLHPMVTALRNEDLEALANFDDIAPIGLVGILDGIERKLRSKGRAVHKVKPGDKTFVQRTAAALIAMGHDEEDAVAAAQATEATGTASNMTEGTKQAMAALTVPRRISRSKKNASADVVVVDFSARPNDYRRAIQEAKASGTTTLQKLKELGMAPHLDTLLALA